jgi:anti-sigma factor RsiW
MCPDRQIISLYLDGELPSPWDGKMEAHLESCEKCRAILAGYRNIRNYLSGNDEKALEEKTLSDAQERVWQKIAAPRPVIFREGRKAEGRKASEINRIWSRNISLPLPVAAAAALVFIVFFVLAGARGLPRPAPVLQDQAAASNIGLNDKEMVNIQDMTGVLQYLSSQDYGDFMVIRLPESRTFSRTGEPALINAADYSSRGLSR